MALKKIVKLLELNKKNVPEAILYNSVIVGFGKLGLSQLSNQNITVDMILAPIIDGRRRLDQAHRLNVNITDLSFLAARMPIRNGDLSDREVNNQFAIKIKFPSEYKPDIVKLSEIPINKSWYPPIFKEKFSDFFQSCFVSVEATRLDTQESVQVFVPCSELLRFYLPHTALIKAAFSAELASVVLYNPEVDNKEELRPFVQLRRDIPDICAPHVARIRHSIYAEKIFNRIYTDSVYSAPLSDTGDRFLRMVPPLQGQVDWLVEANQLENGELLINGIHECGGDFPFSELLFGRDNDGRSPFNRKKPKKINYIPIKHPKFDPTVDIKDDTTGIPLSFQGNIDVQIETLTIEFDFESDKPNFSKLVKVPVNKIEKLSVKDPDTMNVRVYVGEEAVKGIISSGIFNTGEKDKFAKAEISTGTIKKSQVKDRIISTFDAFIIFQDAMRLLSQNYQMSWRKVTTWRILKKDSFYINSFFPNEVMNNDFLRLNNKKFQSSNHLEQYKYIRKFVVAELTKSYKKLYFVDFESKTSKSSESNRESTSILFFYHETGALLSDNELKNIIYEYTSNRSLWKKIKNDGVVRFNVTHHADAKMLADKLERKAFQFFDKD